LATARRAMALWRAIHVPMALVLMVIGLIHVVGVLYYALLLR
jgi:ABC-type sugar transport system permease subunit